MSRPVLIATALSYNSLGDKRLWGSWSSNQEQVRKTHPCKYFVAVEFDGRGRDPFGAIPYAAVGEQDADAGEVWWYGLDDGRTEVTAGNRLRHFVMGQNLCIERALELGAHLLYVGAGIAMPPDILPKLLETGHRAVGPYVPAYAQRGEPAPPVASPALWDGTVPPLEYALPAGCILLDHSLLAEGIRWRSHSDGLSDDFGLQRDVRDRHGVETVIRTDLIAHKHPPVAVPVEDRGYDRRVFW